MAGKRDSGIELLRIIAILMVIGVHAFLYGNYFEAAKEQGGLVSVSAWLLRLAFRPAVNIFVIITGYFMVRTRFNLRRAYKRVFSMYMVVYFYSVVLSLITLLAGAEYYTVNGVQTPVHVIIIKMLLPVLSQNWYYISDYILLCLFAPFVNITLQSITKRQYQVLLALCSVVMSLWFVLAETKPLEDVIRTYGYSDIFNGKNVFSFIFIYIIGGYIGLHVKKNDTVKYRYLAVVLLCLAVNFVLATKLDKLLGFRDVAISYTNPLIILMAVFMLMFFKDLHFYSRIVNRLASATLGIYAIHEFKYVRMAIWNVFDFRKIDNSNLFLNMVNVVGVIIIIFIVCAAAELLRQRLFAAVKRKVRAQ